MKPGAPRFSPAEVFRIRLEWDDQTIDVRAWSRRKDCVPETIRKIGRRDTYTTGVFASEAGHASPEPTADEMAASLARLTQVAEAAPMQRPEVEAILDEMMKKGQQT